MGQQGLNRRISHAGGPVWSWACVFRKELGSGLHESGSACVFCKPANFFQLFLAGFGAEAWIPSS